MHVPGTFSGQVVLLNGPAGVGKTTVGRALAGRVRNGACVHGDDLKRFVVARDPGSVPNGMSYVAGAAVADAFVTAGYDLAVFEFIFSKRAYVDRFLDALQADVPVHLLTLWAPLASVIAREEGRPGRVPLGARVAECWHELDANLGELGVIVDADRPFDEVVISVERHLADGSARLGRSSRST